MIPGVPDRTEPDYHFTYLDQVGGDDVLAVLEAQRNETLWAARRLLGAAVAARYSSGKMERAISCVHVSDTERHSGHA